MNSDPPRMAPKRPRRAAAFVVGALWIGALAGLAWWTANPATLNVEQIYRSRALGAVVRATVLDLPAGKCRVEEVLGALNEPPSSLASGSEIVVVGLKQSGARPGQEIILPLVIPGQQGPFEIAPTRFQATPSYPATPELLARVTELLDGGPPLAEP